MRVGLVIYGELSTLSGGYLYDRQLVRYLREAGCTVDILSLPWRNYAAHLSDNIRLAWAQQIAGSGYDILLEDELNHPSLFMLNRYLQQISTTPIIGIVHHLRASEHHPRCLLPLYRTIERQFLCTLDAVICNSHTTQRNVYALTHSELPAVVAYPAADHLAPPPRHEVHQAIGERLHSQNELQIMFVGNLIPRKGLHTLLDALAHLLDEKWHLHIVGSPKVDPEYSAKAHARATQSGLDQRITWHGRLPDAVLASLLRQCDVLAMPAYEGFGIVFLEAMAYGLPVVAATFGAAPELIKPGVNGYLVQPTDDIALAAYLRLFASNRVQLANLAHHARQTYDTHPTWHDSMRRAHEWLCELKDLSNPTTGTPS